MKAINLKTLLLVFLVISCSEKIFDMREGKGSIVIETTKECCLIEAVREGDCEEVKKLIGQGADVDVVFGDNDYRLLHIAAMAGYKEVVEFLIEKGADVNQQDNELATPLHMAAMEGHKRVVEFLIEKEANVDQQDDLQATPLHWAASSGYKGVVEFLIEKGANVDQQDKERVTPLHMAAMGGHKGVVEFLIEKEANVDQQDKERVTPLHMAAQKGHLETVKILYDSGGDLNLKTTSDFTPLHYAIENEHVEVVKFFLQQGAIFLKDKQGSRVLQLAKKNSKKSKNYTEILKLLSQNYEWISELL